MTTRLALALAAPATLACTLLVGCGPASTNGTDDYAQSSSAPRRIASGGAAVPQSDPAPAAASLPAGTSVTVKLLQDVDSGTATEGSHVSAAVAAAVADGGRVAIPEGTSVSAVVAEAHPAKRFGGRASITVRFTSIDTNPPIGVEGSMSSEARSQKGKDTAIIAGSAVGGALLGKVVGGSNKDAAAGAVVGGGIGTAVASKRGDEALLSSGQTSVVHTTASYTPID